MDSTAIPLMVIWCMNLYMPFAVSMYLYYKEMPSIKHRMPVGTASAGFFASVYCLTQPLCAVYGESASCGPTLLVLTISGNTAVILLLWSAFVVLVLYSITNIIAEPSNVPHDRVAVWNYFRGMIIPSFQIPIGIIVCIIWNLPHILLLLLNATTINELTYSQCIKMDFFVVLSYIAIFQTGLIVVAFTILTIQLRHTMDTFQVRWSFEYTCLFFILCCTFCIAHWLLSSYTTVLAGYHVAEVMVSEALQGIVLFNIFIPLVNTFKERHKVQDHTGSTSLQVNWDAYLKNNESYLNFMEYCQGHTSILLAWKACTEFRQGETKLTVFELYQAHIAPDGPYSVYTDLPDDLRRKYTKKINRLRKKASLVMTHRSKVVPLIEDVDNNFFEPLRRELVRYMVTKQLSQYERDELGKDWIAFHTRRRSIHSLEYIQKVATKSDLVREAGLVKPEPLPLWASLAHSKSSESQAAVPNAAEVPESPSKRTGESHKLSAGNVVLKPPIVHGKVEAIDRQQSNGEEKITATEPTAATARKILFELDIESIVPVLNDEGETLGSLVVHIRPLTKANQFEGNTSGNNAKSIPKDVDDLSDDEIDELSMLNGSFLWVAIDVHLDTSNSTVATLRSKLKSSYHITYKFFQSNTQVFPIEHATSIKVLVNSKFVDYVSTETLCFDIVPSVVKEDVVHPAPSMNKPDTEAVAAMQNALLEEIQRDKAKMYGDHEAEIQRNLELRNELSKLIDHVKEQENTIQQHAQTSQQNQTELVRLQEKYRADVREKEQLKKQLDDADTKYKDLLENANPKSKTCNVQ